MKKLLLPDGQTYFKTNLHCHTVLSDGHKTPEEIKRDYKAHGYSAVAFTDHDKYIDHKDLTDADFTALNGFELEYYKEDFLWQGKTAHLCFIAKDGSNRALGWSDPLQDSFAPRLAEGEHPQKNGGGLYTVLPCARSYTPEYINADIAAAKRLGFFVTYNHPSWSLEGFPDYSSYMGFDAMEMVNYGCIEEGYEDDNGRVYTDLLTLGRDVSCIAADDNHNARPDGHPASDSYGACTMIAAPDPSYKSLMTSLECGTFYCRGTVNPNSDEAPYIKSVWLDGSHVYISTSPAKNIICIKDRRRFARDGAPSGQTIDGAEFDVKGCRWFRLVVISEGGNKAYTNAFYPKRM